MDRLTTDTPKNNFETLLNMVYGKDGWGYIRSGEQDKPIQDFVLELCKKNGCGAASILDGASLEEKDNFLCDCVFEPCAYADVYAALCGFCHVRSRLKMYEDAGMMPPCKEE